MNNTGNIIVIIAAVILSACSCNLDVIPDNIAGGNSDAGFTFANSCNTPYEILFTNTSTLNGETFSWNFGDPTSGNNTSLLENPSHFFSEPGHYTVELMVDSSGVTANISHEVEVTEITFETAFGGGIMDSATAIVKAHDGGYFITGYTKSKGNDILIYKTNLCNDELVYTSVGGSGSYYGNSISQTIDGGYIIAGVRSFFGSSAYVVKLNGNGNSTHVWEQADVNAYSALQFDNGDIIIAGSIKESTYNYDAYIVKTNSNLGGASSFYAPSSMFTDEYYQVIDLSNDAVAAVGKVWVGFGYRITFVSVNYSFALPFTYSIEIIVGDNSVAGESLAMTGDGGFVITGWYNNVFDQDPPGTFLKKISGGGGELWEKQYLGGTGLIGHNEPKKVINTQDGGFLILGNHKLETTPDLFILKTDSNGNYQWDKSFGGSGIDFGNDVIEEEDGGFVIVGYTESLNSAGEEGNVYFIKTDANGNVN